MDRKSLVNEIRGYFQGSEHWRRLVAYIQDPDPRNAHVHSYVYTSVHPDSLEKLLRLYFAAHGCPVTRTINRIRPRSGILALHSIEPKGKAHFDFHWVYKEGAGIKPAHGVEGGSNLLLWNRVYIEGFYGRFPFRAVGSQEREALRQYFRSEHWQNGLEIAERPDVPHMHFNVETSVHPDVIGQYALEALQEKGWSVDYLCPNVFLLGDMYIGKVVFMGRKPEKVYDIGWKFNPGAIIEPTNHHWMYPERIGYDVMTSDEFRQELSQHPYVDLTTEEVSAVMDGIANQVPIV